jgi:2-iminoacetate synthase
MAPYRADAQARNDVHTSQVLDADLRRPRDILSRIESTGVPVDHFVDPTQVDPVAVG